MSDGDALQTFKLATPANGRDLAFSLDGESLIAASTRQVLVYVVRTGEKRELFGDLTSVDHIAHSPDGRHLAVADRAGVIYVLRLGREGNK